MYTNRVDVESVIILAKMLHQTVYMAMRFYFKFLE